MADSAGTLEATSGWIAATVLLIVALAGAILLSGPLGATASDEPASPRVITPVENGTGLWPYTARAPNHGARTLAINVVVLGDTDYVREAMLNRSGPTWTETPPEKEDADPETFAADVGSDTESGPPIKPPFWGSARGSTRYTYVVEQRVGGRWLTESYQVHDGSYFGRRTHVRAYEDPGGEWTAMQAHDEYWDWFRLRHTVTGVASAQRTVERDFMGAPFVDGVVRLPYHHGASGSGRWVTVVHVSLFLGAGLVAVRLDRLNRLIRRGIDRFGRELGLGLALLILYLGVRVLGIGLEGIWPRANPHYLAAPVYLVLVLGLPALTHRLGSGADPNWAFASAASFLGGGFVVDAIAMDVSVLPLQFVLHRTAVLFGVGLIAYGSAIASHRGGRVPLIAGVLGWVAVLVPPALGYL